jgi:membrane protein implicated in regulation of membrane protease activity
MEAVGTIVVTVFSWLPNLTTGLQFGTALIGFGLAVGLLVRARRRRQPG